MTKSDASKSTKRKGKHGVVDHNVPMAMGYHSNSASSGTRSVSTLTPAQLARKRANDREAQRAIRARTKEHIENLEREIEELRSSHSRDETVRNLLRRNKALEDELHRTRESMGITSGGPRNMYPSGMMVSKGVYATRSHHDAAYHSPSSRSSPMAQGNSDYPGVHDIPPYDSMGSSGEPWSSTVSCTVPSTVSSPSSSGATDELGSAYFPTSAPTSLLDRSGIPSSMNSPTASCLNGKMGYDDMKSDLGCTQINVLPMPPAYHQPPPWNMYPMYYQGSPAL
ncbi:hypothetical protein PG984_002457 [Apiospora sp. TS-2023a]